MLSPEFVEPFAALPCKRFVAHGQYLIEHEDAGTELRCNGEAQARGHSRRQRFNRLVAIFLQLCEIQNRVDVRANRRRSIPKSSP